MSGTYTRMILIQDMGCFIYVELKNPPQRGKRYYSTNAIIRSEGKRNIVKGETVDLDIFGGIVMFFRKLLSSLNAKVKKTAVGVLSVAIVAGSVFAGTSLKSWCILENTGCP